MKKTAVILLAICILLSLAACTKSEPLGCEGTYICAAIIASDMTLTGEEAEGMTFMLEVGGKGECVITDSSYKIKWKLDGSVMRIRIDGEELVGTYSKDKVEFANFMDNDVDCIFAIEGSEAADPRNYLTAEERQVIRSWYPYRVCDVFEDPIPDAEFAPRDFSLTLCDDHTALLSYKGEELSGGGKWMIYEGLGSFESSWDLNGEEASVYFETDESDRYLEVTFSCGDLYYIFPCAEKDTVSTLRFAATRCTLDGDEYDPGGDYIEIYGDAKGLNEGVVCYSGLLLNIEYTWYEDDSFEFIDADGDSFTGKFVDNTLVGSYLDYEYVFEAVE